MLKLNLGAGGQELPGYIAIDRKTGGEAFPLKDYADNSVDEIRASHLLEHFAHGDIRAVLADWVRALKPEGILKIAVPDFAKIQEKPAGWASFLMGGQRDENDFHKSVFNHEILKAHMEDAGLSDIKTWESEIPDCASKPVSLNLQGVKQSRREIAVRVGAVASVPRLGFNDHFSCIQDAFSPNGIRVSWHTGAFWEQGIQNTLDELCSAGMDWLFTIDYDTLFTAAQVRRMLQVFADNPSIDALASNQPRRNWGNAMVTAKDANGNFITQIDCSKPFKARTAHFGLTLLRCSALKRMPKPWFWSQPSKDGNWKDVSHVDADIYFWKKWEQVGNSLFVDPWTNVGHMELQCSVFVEEKDAEGNFELKQRHMSITDWRKMKQKEEATNENPVCAE